VGDARSSPVPSVVALGTQQGDGGGKRTRRDGLQPFRLLLANLNLSATSVHFV